MSRALLPAVLLFILPLLAGCATYNSYYAPAITQIREDLPAGTSLGRVDAYLDQHQIEHTYYHHGNQIMATVQNVRRDGLVQYDQTLVFSFDAYRNLTDILVKPAYTSP